MGRIVAELKSSNWNYQNSAIRRISDIDFSSVRADDLFVLGRNVYQAACGDCYDCQSFINSFLVCVYIPDEAKEHILNGMCYEIYYDNQNKIRRALKCAYAEPVITLIENERFYNCREFICTRLLNENIKMFYIPGQNEKVRVYVNVIETEECLVVADIICNGKSLYYNNYDNEKIDINHCEVIKSKLFFEEELRKKMGIMKGYLKCVYNGADVDNRTRLLLPCDGYSLFPRDFYDE